VSLCTTLPACLLGTLHDYATTSLHTFAISLFAAAAHPVVPTVPFWTNMARMAVIARRELASSELSFLVLISGSLDLVSGHLLTLSLSLSLSLSDSLFLSLPVFWLAHCHLQPLLRHTSSPCHIKSTSLNSRRLHIATDLACRHANASTKNRGLEQIHSTTTSEPAT
jgi:hypothetical protein